MATVHGTTEVVETVLSTVWLSGDRVYKLLKPVTTGFVDFSLRVHRLAAAAREFELNHRISPDVYLGTADVIEHGHVSDRMIVMQRLPADRQMDRLVGDPDFQHQVLRVARLVAAFHAGQPPLEGPAACVASVDALRQNWRDNFEALAPVVGTAIPAEEFQRVELLANRYLDGRQMLFEDRIAAGMVRDGHGDLRCEHVFCLEDGPRLIDCLAFRDDLRAADVLNDVAFLAMDLHRLAGPAMAKLFIERYDEFFNEHHPASLAHFYVAYRAHVRAKVAAIRFAQGDHEVLTEVADYHRLAADHLEVGQPKLIVVGGGAGVGKSTVAAGLAERLGATWIRSDEIRKQLAGVEPGDHLFCDPGAGQYSPRFSNAVYREMVNQAELLVTRGHSVVLDATWADDQHRELLRTCADRTSAALLELCCEAPLGLARERIARRMASHYNPSDATPEIADHIAAGFDPWPAAMAVDTSGSIADSVERAYCQVMDLPYGDAAVQPPSVVVDDVVLSEETIGFYLSRVTRLSTGAFLARPRTTGVHHQ
jgi:aminoglycoside phosphotransferase family enzyme